MAKFKVEKMELVIFGFIKIKIPREFLEEVFAKLREKVVSKKGLTTKLYDEVVETLLDELYGKSE